MGAFNDLGIVGSGISPLLPSLQNHRHVLEPHMSLCKDTKLALTAVIATVLLATVYGANQAKEWAKLQDKEGRTR